MLKKLNVRGKYILLLVLRIPFEALRTFINSLFLKESFTAIEKSDFQKLSAVCGLFLLEFLILFAYNGTVWRFFGSLYARMQAGLKKLLLQSLMKKSVEEIDKKSTGDLLFSFNVDVEKALAIYGEPWNLVFLLNGIFNLIISSILVIQVSLKLFFLVIIFVLPLIIITNYVISSKLKQLQTEIQKVSGELTEMYASLINLFDIVRLYDCEDFLKNKIDNKNLELKKLSIKKGFYVALNAGLFPLIGLSGYLVLMICGGSMMLAGIITYSTLLYVCQLRGGILPATQMIINSSMNIKMNKVSLKRIREIL